jgi:hypothetical protein
MGTYHRKQMKKLFGHPDFAPVLASDTLVATASAIQAPVAHTVAGSWILPRGTDIKGLVVMATGDLVAGQVDVAVTYDGAVAASGSIAAGERSLAVFVDCARANAAIADAGALLEVVYTVVTDLGTGQELRLAAPVDYLGKQ